MYKTMFLLPVNLNQVHQAKKSLWSTPPRKLLHKAITETIAPPMSQATKDTVANSNRKRKHVQAKAGEILTSSEVLKCLEIEEEDRQNKAKAALTKMLAAKKLAQLTFEPDSESSDDEDDDISCKQCGRYWSIYKGKKSENWLICDLCNQYICLKCVPKDVDLNKDFFCNDCSVGD